MTRVIVHCSDSSFGNAALISKWHTLERGWDAIGYHYVILNGQLSPKKMHLAFDGHIETGRPLDDDYDLELDERGSHAFGYNDSVGICLIGLSGAFSQAQWKSLRKLIKQLREQFGDIKVLQHSNVSNSKPLCAGLDYYQMKSLNSKPLH